MYLVFDIGGTKMRLALSRDLQTFSEPKVVATPANKSELVKVFAETAQELLGEEKPEAIAGGISRRFQDLIPELQQVFSCLSFFENDAALAGLGEALSGAGRGAEIVVYLTVSTGVGGARIVEGKIDEKVTGFEPGKQIIDYQNERQTLEDNVSGRALQQQTGRSPKLITEAVIWERLAKILAYGLHNTVMHWSPSVVVLGGSMITGQPSINLETVKDNLKQISTVFPELPALKAAELADFGGLYGALHFLQQKLSK